MLWRVSTSAKYCLGISQLQELRACQHLSFRSTHENISSMTSKNRNLCDKSLDIVRQHNFWQQYGNLSIRKFRVLLCGCYWLGSILVSSVLINTYEISAVRMLNSTCFLGNYPTCHWIILHLHVTWVLAAFTTSYLKHAPGIGAIWGAFEQATWQNSTSFWWTPPHCWNNLNSSLMQHQNGQIMRNFWHLYTPCFIVAWSNFNFSNSCCFLASHLEHLLYQAAPVVLHNLNVRVIAMEREIQADPRPKRRRMVLHQPRG